MSHPAIPAELLAPPTENPCPPWCELRAGHGYESIAPDGERLFLYHSGHEVRLPLSAGGARASRSPARSPRTAPNRACG